MSKKSKEVAPEMLDENGRKPLKLNYPITFRAEVLLNLTLTLLVVYVIFELSLEVAAIVPDSFLSNVNAVLFNVTSTLTGPGSGSGPGFGSGFCLLQPVIPIKAVNAKPTNNFAFFILVSFLVLTNGHTL